MHGIVGARTFSLRLLRQKIFSTPLLVVCYTLLGRNSHLMLLDCWRRWKCYWVKRRHWLRARWKFRLTWIHERCAKLFEVWKAFIKEIKDQRLEAETEKAMGISFYRRGAVVRQPTISDMINSSEKESSAYDFEKNKGFANKPLLGKCFAVMNDGAEGKLALMPDRREFMTLMKAFWERPQVGTEEGGSALNSTRSHSKTGKAEGGHASSDSEDSQGDQVLLPANNRILDEEADVFAALSALDLRRLAECVLSQQEVLPEHIERFSVGLGDKYVPLVALLLARCTPYMAKRILLGDLKDQIMRCNSPLIALLIGTHVTRWSDVQLTIREVKSATDDQVLAPKAGSGFQTVFILRSLALVLLKQRCRDLIDQCSIDPTRKEEYTEAEGVALVLRRKKLQKLWRTEEVVRDLLGVQPDPAAEEEKEALRVSYAEYYVGKVGTRVEQLPHT